MYKVNVKQFFFHLWNSILNTRRKLLNVRTRLHLCYQCFVYATYSFSWICKYIFTDPFVFSAYVLLKSAERKFTLFFISCIMFHITFILRIHISEYFLKQRCQFLSYQMKRTHQTFLIIVMHFFANPLTFLQFIQHAFVSLLHV